GFFRQLRIALYIATFIPCLLAYAEVYAGATPLLPFIPDGWLDFRAGILRCRSTFFHPIAYACFLNLVFPFVLVEFLSTRQSKVRLLMGGLGISILVAALLTVSRAPWIILALEVAALLAWECRKDIRRMVFILTIGLIVVSSAFLSYQLNDTVESLFQPFINPGQVEEGSSEYYRVVVFEAVWARVQSPRIFFGYGPNAFNYANIEVTYDNTTRILLEPDLHYARILFEFGAIGSGLILLLIARGIWRSIRSLREATPEQQRWILAALAGVVGFVLVNFTVSMFPMFPLGMIFWMCLAIALRGSLGTEQA
ncbi:MAG: O-antigen ligase family protein, partial [Candidatus Hydrogenedentes bacterium]|nr:O-antigen ligase family protein [Candidatus Hydrogenedentota bacterium]